MDCCIFLDSLLEGFVDNLYACVIAFFELDNTLVQLMSNCLND